MRMQCHLATWISQHQLQDLVLSPHTFQPPSLPTPHLKMHCPCSTHRSTESRIRLLSSFWTLLMMIQLFGALVAFKVMVLVSHLTLLARPNPPIFRQPSIRLWRLMRSTKETLLILHSRDIRFRELFGKTRCVLLEFARLAFSTKEHTLTRTTFSLTQRQQARMVWLEWVLTRPIGNPTPLIKRLLTRLLSQEILP